jgi:hypothetical protein
LKPAIHDLRGMLPFSVYDTTQWDDSIKDGDVLLTDEGVAIMCEAWPVMVIGTSRVLHIPIVRTGSAWEHFPGYTESVQLAWAVACQ